MNKSRMIDKYLRNYGVRQNRPITISSIEGIERSIVIPALAEKASLFKTLASISCNPSNELTKTLVICVVNNHRPQLSSETDVLNNQQTLKVLKLLVSGHLPPAIPADIVPSDLQEIIGSNLRLACIDASSSGLEIPDREGGVGMARKIGMDVALELLNESGAGGGVILCLDADTLVARNYISAVCNHFEATGNTGAVVSFAHQMPSDHALRNAICGYEIFLRAYVMGLSFAGSPYAFHSIGSAMACTVEGYASVRGMNRREAAEDFHFLNKLAKIGNIGSVGETTVFPSPRISHRVPFGTGRQMNRMLTAGHEWYQLYDPSIFVILREWLDCVVNNPDSDPEMILSAANKIHPFLMEFLCLNRFERDWKRIRLNCSDCDHLIEQFHVWFDGLMTLRLLNYFSRSCFPPIAVIDALRELFGHMQETLPCIKEISTGIPEGESGIRILDALRSRFIHVRPIRTP